MRLRRWIGGMRAGDSGGRWKVCVEEDLWLDWFVAGGVALCLGGSMAGAVCPSPLLLWRQSISPGWSFGGEGGTINFTWVVIWRRRWDNQFHLGGHLEEKVGQFDWRRRVILKKNGGNGFRPESPRRTIERIFFPDVCVLRLNGISTPPPHPSRISPIAPLPIRLPSAIGQTTRRFPFKTRRWQNPRSRDRPGMSRTF